MLAEVASTDSRLPETRSELFDRACPVMLEERNPRHDAASHARKTDEELLLAAGAICAALLLCDRVGVYVGPTRRTPEGFVNLADLGELPYGNCVNDARRTRLFQAEGENRFVPVHRVIAEHLGARWLARRFEDGVSERSIFALFQSGDGVPTSLRGLHAWIAHFNRVLSFRCIAADPYAIVRYGDAENLDSNQARSLLDALKRLSDSDPYFRSGDWDRHPASSLMRKELREDILEILDDTDRHRQLSALLLEAMPGTSLAKTLLPTLESVVFDRNRRVEERSLAAEALHKTAPRENWIPVIDRLLGMNDLDSSRLAFEFLRRVGLSAVPETTSIRIFLAYFGLCPVRTLEDEPFQLRCVPDNIFADFNAERGWRHGSDALVETARAT